ncbi:MAG: hypothetical protein WCA78_12555 [Rhizomicrobium sp.]
MSDQNSTEENLRQRLLYELDHIRTHLQRWSIDVSSIRTQAWDAQKVGTEFSRLALQSAFIVNGGALIALPPLMQWLSTDKRVWVLCVAPLFVIGIILAAACATVAFFNFTQVSDAFHAQAEQSAIKLNAEFEGRQVADDSNYKNARTAEANANVNAKRTRKWALSLGIASYVCFAAGATCFVTLAISSNPATEAKVTNTVSHCVMSNALKGQAAKATPTCSVSPPRR